MLKQIRLLTKALVINSYGLNEVRYTKDKSKKARFKGFLGIAVFLILMLALYSVGFSVGLESLGQGSAVPVLLFAAASVIILFFTIFKAGAVIFQTGSYQMTASLPVSTAAIVISRFIKMYLSNLFFGAVTVLPGAMTHGAIAGVGVAYYINLLLGTVIMPFIPLIAATAIGAGITAISSRMKHKSLAASVLGILFVAVILALSMFSSSLEGTVDMDAIGGIISTAVEKLRGVYFPAALFDSAVTDGSYLSLLIFALISFAAFALMIFILQGSFFSICTALNATTAKNNYRMSALGTSSQLTALLKREFRRYFASSPYVINTFTGFVMMLVMSVSVLVVGVEKIEEAMQLEGVVNTAFPYLLAMLAAIAPTTASAVSMEGKYWWVSQTLPISQKNLWRSKILVNLILSAPFLLASCVISCVVLQPSPLGIVRCFLIPVSFEVFASVLGIFVNIRFPLMKWDADVRVVKQSAAMLITMSIGMIAVGIAAVPAFVFADMADAATFVTAAVILAVSAALYAGCNKTDIRAIE